MAASPSCQRSVTAHQYKCARITSVSKQAVDGVWTGLRQTEMTNALTVALSDILKTRGIAPRQPLALVTARSQSKSVLLKYIFLLSFFVSFTLFSSLSGNTFTLCRDLFRLQKSILFSVGIKVAQKNALLRIWQLTYTSICYVLL